MDGRRRSRAFAYRLKRLPPAPSAEHLCQYAEGERKQHPRPVHAVQQYVIDAAEVEVAVHPIQDDTSEQERKQYFDCIVDNGCSFHAVE